MHLFYAPDIAKTPFLPEEESLHCIKVLRRQEGDEIEVIDGQGGLYRARVRVAHARRTEVEIVSVTRDFGAHPYRLHLAVAPTKNIDRFEWFVEKATEIGFDTLTPIVCRYSERRVIKPERVEKILVSAAKQSLKARVPELREMVEFDRLVEQCSGGERLIAHCHDMPKVRLFDACGSCRDVTVCIGPEGDFSTEEVERAMRAGWRSVSLGESRLRTETAGVVACHTVGLRFGV